MIDDSFKSDSAKVQYELTISEVSGGYSSTIDVHFTDYLVEAMDIKDKWTSRGAIVEVKKITTERLKL